MSSFRQFQFGFCGLAIAGLVGCNNTPQPTASISPTVQPSVTATPSLTPTPPQKSQAAKDLEQRLKTEVSKAAGISVQSVECPDQLPVASVKTFTCQAQAEGKTFAIAITSAPNNKSAPTSNAAPNNKSAPTSNAAPNNKSAPNNNSAPTTNATPTSKSTERQWNTKGLLVLPKLEKTIAKGILDEFKVPVRTNCGGKIRIAKPGETFQCQITDQRGQSRAVTVRVDDEAGNVTWKL